MTTEKQIDLFVAAADSARVALAVVHDAALAEWQATFERRPWPDESVHVDELGWVCPDCDQVEATAGLLNSNHGWDPNRPWWQPLDIGVCRRLRILAHQEANRLQRQDTADHDVWHGEIANGWGVRCSTCNYTTRAESAPNAAGIASKHKADPYDTDPYDTEAHLAYHRTKFEKRCTCAMNPANHR